jgi:competence protein ComGF
VVFQRKRGGSRPAFTLIECCAALAVFAAILLLWRPIVQLTARLQPNDGELVEILAANRELDELASSGKLGVSGDDLIIQHDGKTYVIDDYDSAVNGKIVRMSTTNGGYMPLVGKAKSFHAQQIAPGVVAYTIQLLNGEQFTAVLTAGQAAPRTETANKKQLLSKDESAVSESKEAVAGEQP